MTITEDKWDIIFAGGGLANGLIAFRLKQSHPHLNILIIEQDDHLGGNHTWSFHEKDLTPEQHEWIRPFIVHQWPYYEVVFQSYKREIPSAYYSISSERFHHVLTKHLSDEVMTNTRIQKVTAREVVLEDGRCLQANAVIDGRGFEKSNELAVGYQKFIGWEVVCSNPHGRDVPIIMDARVPQLDGYRFVYTLPYDTHTLLIEDTYYSDHANLDSETLNNGIENYASQQGWKIDSVRRIEKGILPITMAGDIQKFWNEKNLITCSGLRAALFNPTTGYSLAYAVRLADKIGRLSSINSKSLAETIKTYSIENWEKTGFYRFLNRMLYQAALPEERHKVLARFYQLPFRLIDRFYAGHLTLTDKIRLLIGKPPVPIGRALRCLSESQCLAAQKQKV